MRTASFLKTLFLAIAMPSLFLLFLTSFNVSRNTQQSLSLERKIQLQQILLEQKFKKTTDYEKSSYNSTEKKGVTSDLKYILLWTNSRAVPFVYIGEGQKGFIANGCPYTNCYSTGNRNLLGDVTKFDLVAFNGPQVMYINKDNLPQERSPHQKYVFANIESAHNYPICDDRFDRFFNWTWTYKLNSDAKWGYLVIRDKDQTIIGPKVDMHWMKHEDMDPVSEELKYQLKSKTKAAAWFVSNCQTRSGRENYVKELKRELKSYNLNVDIYGKCGNLKCERGKNENQCTEMVKEKYYFYLAFENSFAEDYVTEKLLHALQNDAVPIVYGGANYTRFMPKGIYLNARELGAKELAKKMKDLINNPAEYAQYFRWKNHYSFYRRMQSVETNDYCIFCAILNNKELVETTTVYNDFKKWWMVDGCHK